MQGARVCNWAMISCLYRNKITVHLISLALTGPQWVFFSLKFGMRVLFFLAALFHITASFTLFRLRSLFALYVSYALTGIAMATMYGAVMMCAIALMPPHLESFAAAFVMTAYVGGSTVLSYPVQLIIPILGPRGAFLALGGLTTFALLLCALILPT